MREITRQHITVKITVESISPWIVGSYIVYKNYDIWNWSLQSTVGCFIKYWYLGFLTRCEKTLTCFREQALVLGDHRPAVCPKYTCHLHREAPCPHLSRWLPCCTRSLSKMRWGISKPPRIENHFGTRIRESLRNPLSLTRCNVPRVKERCRVTSQTSSTPRAETPLTWQQIKKDFYAKKRITGTAEIPSLWRY